MYKEKKLVTRKWFALLVVVVLALGAFGVAAAQDGPTIGLSLSTLNNPFFVTLRDGGRHHPLD